MFLIVTAVLYCPGPSPSPTLHYLGKYVALLAMYDKGRQAGLHGNMHNNMTCGHVGKQTNQSPQHSMISLLEPLDGIYLKKQIAV